MSRYYMSLPGGTIRECVDVVEWGKWFGPESLKDFMDGGRIVANDLHGDADVSTVFIGMRDHAMFETMIFGGEHDQSQWRYHTYEEALEGHKNAVRLVKPEDDCDEPIFAT